MPNLDENSFLGFKQYLYSKTVPNDQLDAAIMAGIHKAKQEKKKHTFWMKLSVSTAALLLLFFVVLRTSDTFADYVSAIPGLEKVVELVRGDKGLVSVIQNDYAQKINVSDSHKGIKVTLDSIILDQEQLVLFYSFQSDKKESGEVSVKNLALERPNGQKVELGSWTVGGENASLKGKSRLYSNPIGLMSPIKDKNLTLVMTLEGPKSLDLNKTVWRIPFKINQQKIGSKRTVAIHKTVTVDQQRITVKSITTSPTQIGVTVNFSKGNSKQIFDLEDLRLVDEHNQIWGRRKEGVVSAGGDQEKTFYLQSNYFEKPKKLYLEFNLIRALDKDELLVRVDPLHQKILKSPRDGRILNVVMNPVDLPGYLQLNVKHQGWHRQLFNQYTDGAGKVHAIQSFMDTNDSVAFPYSLTEPDAKKPITLKLLDYPSYISGNVKIRIK
ncbi:DUF4179 domain-containing protein [Heyndrickxia acidicola]|uniref:DUF4179 domain-containing protein n=1 Tax=Heyndrickxia acidicola TaxID=209389 RepID=A0ABU6MMQ4_9BACI|nr:DUF4179 domain-containing protein [Heyndrickxia acidicola]MED1205251.1 DUF4179 domain-containing protein [Heyndrickxia acidicola]